MEQIKNVIKIDGDKNHVSQGTGISSKADIKGNKNDVYQGKKSSVLPKKVNGWTKTQIICTVITAIIGCIGLLFTYIRYKEEINSWVSSLF